MSEQQHPTSPFLILGPDVCRRILTFVAGESVDGVITAHAYRHILPFSLCSLAHYHLVLSSITGLSVLPISKTHESPQVHVQNVDQQDHEKRPASQSQAQQTPASGSTSSQQSRPPARAQSRSAYVEGPSPALTPSSNKVTLFPTMLLPTPSIVHTTTSPPGRKTNLPPYFHRHLSSASASSPSTNYQYHYTDPKLSDRLPRFVGRLAPSLRTLHLFRNSEICEPALLQLANAVPNLQELRLRAFRTIGTDTMRQTVLTLRHSLRVLDLSFCHNISDTLIIDLARNMNVLHTLHLAYWTISDETVHTLTLEAEKNDLPLAKTLTTLDLTSCGGRMSSINWINAFSSLQNLKLRSIHSFNNNSNIDNVTANSSDNGNNNVNNVEDQNSTMTTNGTSTVSTTVAQNEEENQRQKHQYSVLKLPHLQSLDLVMIRRLSDSHVRNLFSSGVFRELHTLNLSHCGQLTEESLDTLVEHTPQIAKLDISLCTHVTGFDQLTRLSYLSSLNLSACPSVTDEVIARLAALPWLRRLAVARCPLLTDDAVYALADRCDVSEDEKRQRVYAMDYVDIRKCPNVSTEALKHLRAHCNTVLPSPCATNTNNNNNNVASSTH